jgi:hypothetical protein
MRIPPRLSTGAALSFRHQSAGKKAPNGLIVCASLPRGKTDYTFRIAARAGRRSLYPNVATQVERTVSVADFFDVNGVFLQLAFREQVFQLVEAFVQQRGVASANSHAADKKAKSS